VASERASERAGHQLSSGRAMDCTVVTDSRAAAETRAHGCERAVGGLMGGGRCGGLWGAAVASLHRIQCIRHMRYSWVSHGYLMGISWVAGSRAGCGLHSTAQHSTAAVCAGVHCTVQRRGCAPEESLVQWFVRVNVPGQTALDAASSQRGAALPPPGSEVRVERTCRQGHSMRAHIL
jgi:hypothetical protein